MYFNVYFKVFAEFIFADLVLSCCWWYWRPYSWRREVCEAWTLNWTHPETLRYSCGVCRAVCVLVCVCRHVVLVCRDVCVCVCHHVVCVFEGMCVHCSL